MVTQQPTSGDDWASLRFMIGKWVGEGGEEGGGGPGMGSGYFTLREDLQGKVLVRKNRADYPATQDSPAYSHEDLMVIYRDITSPAGHQLRAIYFDSEGHIINYSVEARHSEMGESVQFLSDVTPSSPSFRLTYTQIGTDTLALTFEIAPPGTPDTFSTYIEARVRRE